MTRHFLRLSDFSLAELTKILDRAMELKSKQQRGISHLTCAGKTLAMIFELKSTRTRVAFETGIAQLGGYSVFLSPTDTQLGRGEPIADTARVLSEMVDIVMIRAEYQATIDEFANYSENPVINGLSEELHPCQLLADLQTFIELRGAIQDKRVAFVGDGFNMCHSYMEASSIFGFQLHVAHPDQFGPQEKFIEQYGCNVAYTQDPKEAIADADLVVTDVWSSMGHEGEQGDRERAFEGFQITENLLELAKPDVLFMHCLPAHRGEEVNATILDDPRSVVWQEAGNRLHSQKALMECLLNN